MKKSILVILFVSLMAAMFSSCFESRKGSNCPSHDKNYFRR
ncbi:hypothetical protein [Limnovirga soli]|nr:hypothetical protein [Limnovirga soli]